MLDWVCVLGGQRDGRCEAVVEFVDWDVEPRVVEETMGVPE